MPLLQQWSIHANATAAIWQIEEPEDFFSGATGLSPAINSERRRIEHLAGRFLLQHVAPGFPVGDIQKDEHDKPRIPGNSLFFSISHSWPYIAVVVDERLEAGIDIQTWHPRIMAIQHKFLSAAEQAMLAHDHKLVTLAWCAKEAAYKWKGRRGIDFIGHMPISTLDENNNMQIIFNLNEASEDISLKGIITQDFACSYVY